MPFHAGRNEGVMKFRKFTATIALTAVLSSSIASSLTPLTVLATDGEVTTTTEESQDSEPVQEGTAPAKESETVEPSDEKPAEEMQADAVEEKQKESVPAEVSGSESGESDGGEAPKNAASENPVQTETVQDGKTQDEKEASDGAASTATTAESPVEAATEAATESSTEGSTSSSAEDENAEKTYTLDYESVCDGEKLGSGKAELKLSSDRITIEEDQKPAYDGYILDSVDVCGYRLVDEKLENCTSEAETVLGAEDAKVVFHFNAEKKTFELSAAAKDQNGDLIQNLSSLKFTLRKNETAVIEQPKAGAFDQSSTYEDVTYKYVKTLVDGKEQNTVTAEDAGKTVTFVYDKSVREKTRNITVHEQAVDTDGNVIKTFDDVTFSLKKDETKKLDAPASDSLPAGDKEDVTYTYRRTEVDGRETDSVNVNDDGKTVAFVYEKKVTPKSVKVTLKQEAVDTDGNVIKALSNFTAELKNDETISVSAPKASEFDQTKFTYSYLKTTIGSNETDKVTSNDDGKTIRYIYKAEKKAEEKKEITVHQEAVDTDGNVIRRLDDLKVSLGKDETRELTAPKASELVSKSNKDKANYTYEKTLVDGKEADAITASDNGSLVQYVYKAEAEKTEKDIEKTVHVKAVDSNGKVLADLGSKKLTFKTEKSELAAKELLPDSAAFTQKDEKYSYQYTFNHAELDNKKVDTFSATDVSDSSALTFVYDVTKKELPITRKLNLIVKDTDGNVIREVGPITLTFDSSKSKVSAESIGEKYCSNIRELQKTEEYEYRFKEAQLDGTSQLALTAANTSDLEGTDLVLVYQKNYFYTTTLETEEGSKVKAVVTLLDGQKLPKGCRVVAKEIAKGSDAFNSLQETINDYVKEKTDGSQEADLGLAADVKIVDENGNEVEVGKVKVTLTFEDSIEKEKPSDEIKAYHVHDGSIELAGVSAAVKASTFSLEQHGFSASLIVRTYSTANNEIGNTCDLSNYVSSVNVNGATKNDDGTYSVVEDTSYGIKVVFSEAVGKTFPLSNDTCDNR